VSDDDDGPLDVNEEWHACLLAAQLHFQRALLSALINKNALTGEEVRALMFEAADGLRHGGDAAKAEDITYYFANMFEKLGNDFG
jgi:hypothetical protein